MSTPAAAPARQAGPGGVCLVATQTGFVREGEAALLETLQQLHREAPLRRVFACVDGRHMPRDLDEPEVDAAPYRSFPSTEHTAAITDHMVRVGGVSGAFAFAVVSEPPARLLLHDDWFGRALARDAVRRLDADAARLSLALSLLPRAEPAAGGAEAEPLLARLLRLGPTEREHASLFGRDGDAPAPPDARAGAALPDEVRAFLEASAEAAHDFYRGTRLRVRALVSWTAERLEPEERTALLVDVHFADFAEDLLREQGVPCTRVTPAGVAPGPVLDAAADYLGARRNRKLEDALMGLPFRTDVQALLGEGGRPDVAEKRAEEWATAAHVYLKAFEIRHDRAARERAAECLRRALALAPGLPHALWLDGMQHQFAGEPERALEQFERAIAADTRSSHYRLARARSLAALGRRDEAYRDFVRAIHLAPADGGPWTELGNFLHHGGRRRAACYCLARGAALGTDAARENLARVCAGDPGLRACPPSLWPPVIRLMHRYVLPLRYGWGEARMNAGLLAVLGFTLLGAVGGAVLGWRAGGVGGALPGMLVLAVAAALLACALVLNVDVLLHGPGTAGTAFRRALTGLLGAVGGRALGEWLLAPAWEPLGVLALALLGAAVGTLAWLPAALARRRLARRAASPAG